MAAWLQPVMLRLVDDFLVLSPSRAAAEALVLRLMQGGHLTLQGSASTFGGPELNPRLTCTSSWLDQIPQATKADP